MMPPRGVRGPAPRPLSTIVDSSPKLFVGPVVTAGRPDRGMPGFPLDQKQVADIVAFLRAQIDLFDMHTRVPGGYPDDIPASRLATGSVEAGKAYFYGAGGRSKCPSPTGDLAGIAKKYNATDAQINLAWLLHYSPWILPIPGTSSLKHFEENLKATEIELSEEDMKFLE